MHFAMLEGCALTHLNLGKACCDSVLRVVAEKAAGLKYINISGSTVTDQVGVGQTTAGIARNYAYFNFFK